MFNQQDQDGNANDATKSPLHISTSTTTVTAAASPRRCSQRIKCIAVSPRKCTQTSVAVLKESETINNSSSSVSVVKKNTDVHSTGAWPEDENDNVDSTKKATSLKVKRGKRSLTTERDKTSPLSVKVLRRSHTQNVEHADTITQTAPKSFSKRQIVTTSKLLLPVVKGSKNKQ